MMVQPTRQNPPLEDRFPRAWSLPHQQPETARQQYADYDAEALGHDCANWPLVRLPIHFTASTLHFGQFCVQPDFRF